MKVQLHVVRRDLSSFLFSISAFLSFLFSILSALGSSSFSNFVLANHIMFIVFTRFIKIIIIFHSSNISNDCAVIC